MNIAIIYGGKSGEHEVSLVSASAVARNINSENDVILIGITKNGTWYLQDKNALDTIRNDKKATLKIVENPENLVSVIPGGKNNAFSVNGKTLSVDVVFPVLHGTFGEDGTIQGLFEMADVPYVGCNVLASAVTMDKEKTKMILEQAGVQTVPYICVKRTDLMDSLKYDELFNHIIETLGFPLFVKPCNAGSSDGASKAENPKEFSVALMEAFNWDNKVLVEKAINAREIECSVTGNSVTAPEDDDVESVTAYIPGEIAPTHQFYDYDAKYNDPSGASLLIPADLKEANLEIVRENAVKAYKALDLTGMSRIDFFVDKDTNKLYLNEVNTIPGFTSISMFPKMCEAAGLDFAELLDLLIDESLRLYKAKTTLKTSR